MLGHLIGEHRSAHDDPWMLWEEAATAAAAAAAETYNRQMQWRQYSWRGKEPPPTKPAPTPVPCWVLALIWGISVTLHQSCTPGLKENSLPALTQHSYNHKCTHSHGLSAYPSHSATQRRSTWHLYTKQTQTWQAREIRTDWTCTYTHHQRHYRITGKKNRWP